MITRMIPILLFLMIVIRYSLLQQTPRCAYSRLDVTPCRYASGNLIRARENEYSVHSTRLQETNTGGVECRITPPGQTVKPIQSHINSSNVNIKYIFSPGWSSRENYASLILAEYRVSCTTNQTIFYLITSLNIQPKDCIIDGIKRCSDYILIDQGVFGMREICGNIATNPQSTLSGLNPSNNLTVRFRSDEKVTYRGFKMIVVCYNPHLCNISECLSRQGSTLLSCTSICNQTNPISEGGSISMSSSTTTDISNISPTMGSMTIILHKEVTPSSKPLNESTTRDGVSPPVTTVIVASTLATTTFLAVVIIGTCLCVRRKKRKTMETLEITSSERPKSTDINNRNQIELHSYSIESQKGNHDQWQEKPSQYVTELQQLKRDLLNEKALISRNELQLGKVIGEGESGLVYRGYLNNCQPVAIKTVRALASATDKRKLLREVSIMMSFKHPNVMSLVGMCFDDEMPLVIMPFMSDGSVLDYVRQNRKHLYFIDQHDSQEMFAARKKCLDMCHQIAKGMSYLAQQRFVHRDLAARNCMIDGLTEGVIKVADFGLTEDMYGTNYYRRSGSEGQERVPLRWMAPESIESKYYDEATDVWSFGVTCWEILTCGGVPYAGMPAMTLLTELRSGHRIDRPSNTVCSDEIWDLTKSCWATVPKERPTFEDLVLKLYELLDFGTSYLKLQ